MSGASELKPCPFCGGVAEMDTQQAYRALVGGQIGTRVAVYCTSCNADMGFCREDAPGEDREYLPKWVVEWWNRRTPSDEIARLSSAHSEAVEDARKHLAEAKRLSNALTFYAEGFRFKPLRSASGVLSEKKPTPALLQDCGERARKALSTREGGE